MKTETEYGSSQSAVLVRHGQPPLIFIYETLNERSVAKGRRVGLKNRRGAYDQVD